MLNFLSRLPPQRNMYIIPKSPPEQYSNSKVKKKEISDELKAPIEYENAVIVFDNVLGSSNIEYKEKFFIRGKHTNVDIYYLSQSYFVLPKKLYGVIVTKSLCLLKL